MRNQGAAHLSEEQLDRVQNAEGTTDEVAHVAHCAECAGRLRDWDATADAYAEYRDTIRGPLLPAPPKPWRSLQGLIAAHDSEAGEGAGGYQARVGWPAKRLHARWWVPAMAGAIGLVLALVAIVPRSEQPSARASHLLERAALVSVPRDRAISLHSHGRTLIRPAVFASDTAGEDDPELAHIQALFHGANYGWRDPLNPRTFQAWRGAQRERRDSVSVIGGARADRRYVVRTEVHGGTLRSAALSLRVDDLRPIGGDFEFTGEAPISMEDAQPATVTAPVPAGPAAPATVPEETPATPADTLHVLAALDAIGADAGEPLEVSEDAAHRHVVVRAGGLTAERRQEIAKALAPLPRVTLDLQSGPRGTQPTPSGAPESYASSIPPNLRQRFEERLGGAVAVQETTDRTLEASSAMLARVHAIEVLAVSFPPETEAQFSAPDRQTLRNLRHGHLLALDRLVAQISESLRPLLELHRGSIPAGGGNGTGRHWQSRVPELAASARETDQILNRLLAGSYAQASGEEMLRALSAAIPHLTEEIQSVRSGE